MNDQQKAYIETYRQQIGKANKELTKKEHLKDLLRKLYAGDVEIETTLDDMSAGAERTILNIPRRSRTHRGSADTLYNNIIIEYEADLRKSYPHAVEQLAGYLLGEYKTHKTYNYTLIASDFINWKIVAPAIEAANKLDTIQEHELAAQLAEVPTASFTLTEHNGEEFYYWIDRFLFKAKPQKATLSRIKEAFGAQSAVFIESNRLMSAWFASAKKFGEVQVSYEQWKKFLSIAYGVFDDTEGAFLIHTYLSVFAKMMAYSVIRPEDDFIDDTEMLAILDGSIFSRYNIQNFVDNDFFHWVKSDRNFRELKKAFRIIAQEITTFDFQQVDEDILKGVYQELIDIDTRHALGEYYTPDWLCERIVQEYEFAPHHRILDPSCGSGSFLRAAIHGIKSAYPKVSIQELCGAIYGIDIHPLSVQIAKTTLLIALGSGIRDERKPIHLNIILANTLLAPEGVANLFGTDFRMIIDSEILTLSTQVLDDVKLFDEALDVCEEAATQTVNRKVESKTEFAATLRAAHKSGGLTPALIDGFYEIYKGLKTVKEKGRDSIWKFILQNTYKPYFLHGRFDFVIGNPPWFTYNDIKDHQYQRTLNELADALTLKTNKKGTFGQLEIAAIFMAYCSDYFLKDGGTIAFVLPRSFFNGAQHDNTRAGKTKGFRLTEIWDLLKVEPLFRIPSCVLFGKKTSGRRVFPKAGLPGRILSGKVRQHNASWSEAYKLIAETETTYFYSQQGTATAFTTEKRKASKKVNAYKSGFAAGATLRPRAFCIVELAQDKPADWHERIINVRTPDSVRAEGKKSWNGHGFDGRIESEYLFYTATAKSILPFCLFNPDLAVLPIRLKNNRQDYSESFDLLEPDELRHAGAIHAARWFLNVERIWQQLRTTINTQYTAAQYLNYQRKITTQGIDAPFVVLYNAVGKDANALVVERRALDLPFIADYKSYAYFTMDMDEAYYLAAVLNSPVLNLAMKDFQAIGLQGHRGVEKKILDVFFPPYDNENVTHLQLAALSKEAHEKAAQFVNENPPTQQLTPIRLGRLRTAIKTLLAQERAAIDKLVKKIIG